eukprot:CAMPEP_0177633120 /NCGR_PEP_ID=MMETSP0447-20121125/2663_1 /TAXON_ID=0 /ORGANISM="Stygamoeba regulata, Strain BSH-02190019" /LENGTH=311 /DNA_ID=CAMNT_0019134749 /DNA_START=26 /DNA_END=961 /DNA_ORIENTATION=+
MNSSSSSRCTPTTDKGIDCERNAASAICSPRSSLDAVSVSTKQMAVRLSSISLLFSAPNGTSPRSYSAELSLPTAAAAAASSSLCPSSFARNSPFLSHLRSISAFSSSLLGSACLPSQPTSSSFASSSCASSSSQSLCEQHSIHQARRFYSVAEEDGEFSEAQCGTEQFASPVDLPPNSMLSDPNFRRFMRFGLADQSILMICLLAGFSLDAVIARRIGVKGYGTIIGAGVGNAVADGIAGLSDGVIAASGVTVGAALPLIPLFTVMAMRRPLEGRTAWFVGTCAALCALGTFGYTWLRRYQGFEDDEECT